MSVDGDNLIWDSEVVIEIQPYNIDERVLSSKPSQLRPRGLAEAQVEPKRRVTDKENDSKSLEADEAKGDSIVIVNDDAEDECSLYCTSTAPRDSEKDCAEDRGRTLSRSQKTIRCGVNLATTEPYAVPQTHKREKSREYRGVIKREMPTPSFNGARDEEAQQQKRRGMVFSELKRLGQSVRDTFSRSRSRYRNKRLVGFKDIGGLGEDATLPLIYPSSNFSKGRLRPVDSMKEMKEVKATHDPAPPSSTKYSCSISNGITGQQESCRPISLPDQQSALYIPTAGTKEDHRQITPWLQHLEDDLKTDTPVTHRGKKSYYLRQAVGEMLDYDGSVSRRALLLNEKGRTQEKSPRLRQGSNDHSSTSSVVHRDTTNYWRLPSGQSMSKSTSNASLTRNMSSLGRVERMDEVAPSYEFDQTWWLAQGMKPSSIPNTSPLPVAQAVENGLALSSSTEPGDTWPYAVSAPRSTNIYPSESQHSVASILSSRHPTGTHSLTTEALALHSLSMPLSSRGIWQHSSSAETQQGHYVGAWI